MRQLWRVLALHRDYRLLLGAGLISLTGDWILSVGLAYYVYALTGSTLVSGTVLITSFAPRILLGSLAGVYVDRWERRTTMIVANLILAAGLAPLLAITDAHRIWIVYPVVLLETSVAQFVEPAEAALVPQLVGEKHLLSANALTAQNRDVARLVGSALGGVLAAVGGITALALADIASFLAAAGLLLGIRTRRRLVTHTRPRTVLAEWRAGLRLSVQSRSLRVILAISAISGVGEGIMATLFAPFVRSVLHSSGSVYGAIVSAQAVGGIIGGVVAASTGPRFTAKSVLGWGALAFGTVDLALFLYPLLHPTVWPAFLLMVIVGLPAAFMMAGLMTAFQTATADAHRGRVFGAITVVEASAMLAGSGLAGWLGGVLGIIPVLALQGGGYLLSGLVVLRWLPAREVSEPAAQPSPCARSTPPADAPRPRRPASASGR